LCYTLTEEAQKKFILGAIEVLGIDSLLKYHKMLPIDKTNKIQQKNLMDWFYSKKIQNDLKQHQMTVINNSEDFLNKSFIQEIFNSST
jgi:hypothetical protein